MSLSNAVFPTSANPLNLNDYLDALSFNPCALRSTNSFSLARIYLHTLIFTTSPFAATCSFLCYESLAIILETLSTSSIYFPEFYSSIFGKLEGTCIDSCNHNPLLTPNALCRKSCLALIIVLLKSLFVAFISASVF